MADQKLLPLFIAAKRRALVPLSSARKSDLKFKFSSEVGTKSHYEVLECLHNVNKVPLLFLNTYNTGRIVLRCFQEVPELPSGKLVLPPGHITLYQTRTALRPRVLEMLRDDCLLIFGQPNPPTSSSDLPPSPTQFHLAPTTLSSLIEEYELRLNVTSRLLEHDPGAEAGSGNSAFLESPLFHREDTLLRLPALIAALPPLKERINEIDMLRCGPFFSIGTPTIHWAEKIMRSMIQNGFGNAVISSENSETPNIIVHTDPAVVQPLWSRNMGWLLEPNVIEEIAQKTSQDIATQRQQFIRAIESVLEDVTREL